MVSIKDVAKRAGVAISTVSKALNNYPGVSPATKKKVDQAVRELNFVPNFVAAALSSKQSGRVALLMNPDTQTQAIDEIDMQYITGAVNRAMELRLDVITLFFSMFADRTAEEIIRYLKAQSIQGIIVYGMSRDDTVLREVVEAGAFKAVVIDVPFYNRDTSSLWIDQEQAQYDVAEKTVKENACRRVLYIAGKKNGYVTEERLKGMKRLAQKEGLTLFVRFGEFSERQARELTFRYARNRDCIVCASDLMAIGAMRVLMEMDIFRPVCGFDGIRLMGYAGKQMNTVRQDFAGISAEAVTELHWLLNGGEGRNRKLGYSLARMQYLDIIV